MPSPYATNEDHSMLWLEQAIYASTHIGAIAYGIHMTIYILTTYYCLNQLKIPWKWIAFNTTLFVLGTINLATSIHLNEIAWIDERNYPGGPYAFLAGQRNRPVQTVGNAASLIAATMVESLLLYRVYVIWNQWYVSVIPALFFLVCRVLSVIVVIQIAMPFSHTWTSLPSFVFPTWMSLMAFNLLLVSLLAVRLLFMRRQLQASMGAATGKAYMSVVALVIESALPFGILSIIFLVLFGRHDPTQNLFIPLLVQVECISPMLIILRVVRGQAWSISSVLEQSMSTAEFASGPPSSASPPSWMHDMDINLGQSSRFEETSRSTVDVV